jgi:hypothetical protein
MAPKPTFTSSEGSTTPQPTTVSDGSSQSPPLAGNPPPGLSRRVGLTRTSHSGLSKSINDVLNPKAGNNVNQSVTTTKATQPTILGERDVNSAPHPSTPGSSPTRYRDALLSPAPKPKPWDLPQYQNPRVVKKDTPSITPASPKINRVFSEAHVPKANPSKAGPTRAKPSKAGPSKEAALPPVAPPTPEQRRRSNRAKTTRSIQVFQGEDFEDDDIPVVTPNKAGNKLLRKRAISQSEESSAGPAKKRSRSKVVKPSNSNRDLDFASTGNSSDDDEAFFDVGDVQSPTPKSKKSRKSKSKAKPVSEQPVTQTGPIDADQAIIGELLSGFEEIVAEVDPRVPGAPEDNPYDESEDSIKAQIDELLEIQNDPNRKMRTYPQNENNKRLCKRLNAILNGIIAKINNKTIRKGSMSRKLRKWVLEMKVDVVVDIIMVAIPETARQVLGAKIISIQNLEEMKGPTTREDKMWGVYINLVRVVETIEAFYVGSSHNIQGIKTRTNDHVRQSKKVEGDADFQISHQYAFIRKWSGECNFRHLASFDNDNSQLGFVILAEILLIVLTNAFCTSSERKAEQLKVAKDLIPTGIEFGVEFDTAGPEGLNRMLGLSCQEHNSFAWGPPPRRGPCVIPSCGATESPEWRTYPAGVENLSSWDPESYGFHQIGASMCRVCYYRMLYALRLNINVDAEGYSIENRRARIPAGRICAKNDCVKDATNRLTQNGVEYLMCKEHVTYAIRSFSHEGLAEWLQEKRRAKHDAPNGTPCAKHGCGRTKEQGSIFRGFDDSNGGSVFMCKSHGNYWDRRKKLGVSLHAFLAGSN